MAIPILSDLAGSPVAVDPIASGLLDAKGDLIVASAADTAARLAVGTNGQVLTADSAQATGVKWAAGGGGGAKPPHLHRVGRYYSTHPGGATVSTFGPVQNRFYAIPFYLGEDRNFDRIEVEVTVSSASSVLRLGAYADSGYYPGALITDYGTVAASTTGVKSITITLAATAPLIWLACVEQSADAVQIRSSSSNSNVLQYHPVIGKASASDTNTQLCYQSTGVTGSLPATFPASIASTTEGPLLHLRAAA